MRNSTTVYIGIDPAVGPDETAVEICEANGRRLVCRAVTQPGELQDAIMQLALAGRSTYTPAEIDQINDELDKCHDSINVWLRELQL